MPARIAKPAAKPAGTRHASAKPDAAAAKPADKPAAAAAKPAAKPAKPAKSPPASQTCAAKDSTTGEAKPAGRYKRPSFRHAPRDTNLERLIRFASSRPE